MVPSCCTYTYASSLIKRSIRRFGSHPKHPHFEQVPFPTDSFIPKLKFWIHSRHIDSRWLSGGWDIVCTCICCNTRFGCKNHRGCGNASPFSEEVPFPAAAFWIYSCWVCANVVAIGQMVARRLEIYSGTRRRAQRQNRPKKYWEPNRLPRIPNPISNVEPKFYFSFRNLIQNWNHCCIVDSIVTMITKLKLLKDLIY